IHIRDLTKYSVDGVHGDLILGSITDEPLTVGESDIERKEGEVKREIAWRSERKRRPNGGFRAAYEGMAIGSFYMLDNYQPLDAVQPRAQITYHIIGDRAIAHFIDYIATLHKVDKAAFGYGAYFSLAMMDRHYHSGMSVEEAIDLVDKCIVEIRSRLVVAPPNFVIKIRTQLISGANTIEIETSVVVFTHLLRTL
ncbi:hypothetical protein V2J09_014225, partial [Rumex salicifolius]